MRIFSKVMKRVFPAHEQAVTARVEPETEEPELLTKSYKFQLQEGSSDFTFSAQSMAEHDEYKGLLPRLHDARQRISQVESYLRHDQSKADWDPREGHIVRAEHNFEAHNGVYACAQKKHIFSGNDDSARISTRPKPWKAERSINWDKSTGTFTLVKTDLKGHFVRRAGVKSMKAVTPWRKKRHFSTHANGEIPLPTAHSLKEAKLSQKQRAIAQRANQLLQSGRFWINVAETSDNETGDFNPEPGKVVRPLIGLGDLDTSLGRDHTLTKGFRWSNEAPRVREEHECFALESNGTETIVAAHGDKDYQYHSKIRMQKTDQRMTVEYESSENRTTEKVVWNLADQTMSYEGFTHLER